MGTNDLLQTGVDGESPVGHAEPVPPEAAPGPSQPEAGRPWPLWGMVLAVGIAAGLVAWLAGELAYGAFAVPLQVLAGIGLDESPRMARLQSEAQIKSALLTFSLLGAILGMALGGAGGLARRSARAAAAAGAVGLVVGGAAGLGLTGILAPVADRNGDLLGENLLLALLIHGGIWAGIGAVAGLAFGLGAGGWALVPRAVLGGIVGAALGTTVYELLGALAFPLDSTSSPLSTSASSRLLARLALTIPVALGAAGAARESHHSWEPAPVQPRIP